MERTFWPRAFEIGQKLELNDRVALYSIIWDKIPKLPICAALIQTLEKLSFADEAYCPIDALISIFRP
ncbi:MAG: putative virulence factor [Desulfovibrio sp.]|nr:putative virulence factor [Desulfovibrio sp.]